MRAIVAGRVAVMQPECRAVETRLCARTAGHSPAAPFELAVAAGIETVGRDARLELSRFVTEWIAPPAALQEGIVPGGAGRQAQSIIRRWPRLRRGSGFGGRRRDGSLRRRLGCWGRGRRRRLALADPLLEFVLDRRHLDLQRLGAGLLLR